MSSNCDVTDCDISGILDEFDVTISTYQVDDMNKNFGLNLDSTTSTAFQIYGEIVDLERAIGRFFEYQSGIIVVGGPVVEVPKHQALLWVENHIRRDIENRRRSILQMITAMEGLGARFNKDIEGNVFEMIDRVPDCKKSLSMRRSYIILQKDSKLSELISMFCEGF